MNALELHAPKGMPCGVWICGECSLTGPSQDAAEQCCRHRICACGAKCENNWLKCTPCRKRDDEAKAAARWSAAGKVPAAEHHGWVYDDRTDDYHEDVGAFVDAWECDHDEGDEPRGLLYACMPVRLELDAHRILEDATQDHHEDAYCDLDARAIDELQVFLSAWAADNQPGSVEPDYSRAIVLSSQLEAT